MDKNNVKIIKEWEQTAKTIEQLLNLGSNDLVMQYGMSI